MYKLFLTYRYVRKPLSVIAFGALGISVAILTFVPSIMNGFQAEFHARVRGTLSDVSVTCELPVAIERDPRIEQQLGSTPGVAAAAPFILHPALDRHFNKVDYCFLRAVDPPLEEKVSEFRTFLLSDRARFLALNDFDVAKGKDRDDLLNMSRGYVGSTAESKSELADLQALVGSPKAPTNLEARIKAAEERLDLAKAREQTTYRELVDGRPDPEDPSRILPTVLCGIFYLKAYGMDVGEVVKLTTAAAEGGEVQQNKRFVIAGAFQTGRFAEDRRTIYMGLKAAQDLIGVPNHVTGYSIKLDDYARVRTVKDGIVKTVLALRRPDASGRTLLPRGMAVRTWEEQDENLLKAVGMERLLIKLIVSAIVVAASASIFLVLFMSVQNKVRELGILRAVGGTYWGSLLIFLGQGVLIATVGLVFGSVLGLVVAHYVNEIASVIHSLTGWHPFPPDVYYLEKIPSRIDAIEIVQNGLMTLAFGFLAALVPAILAAFRPPIRAIRHD